MRTRTRGRHLKKLEMKKITQFAHTSTPHTQTYAQTHAYIYIISFNMYYAICVSVLRGYHRRRVKAVLYGGRSPGRARDVQYTDALIGRWENPNWQNTGFRG